MQAFRRAATAAVALTAISCVLASAPAGAAVSGTAAVRAPAAGHVTAAAGHVTAARPSGVRARGADLMDATTGRRLWSRGLNVRRPMASLTKVMTALVVLRAGRLGRHIRISGAAVRYVLQHHGSSAGLHAGDVLTARQLLEALLLPSGCDAAFALATAYGRGHSWRAFVRKMNATARQLHLSSTHFANFDGLPWPTEHSTYSTPRDLVLLAETAMRLPAFRAIVGQRSHFIAGTALHHSYYWRSTNLLLGHYRGLTGIKTGSAEMAGYCLLFEARRGRTALIGVVLDSSATDPGARFSAAARLLSWGFKRVGRR